MVPLIAVCNSIRREGVGFSAPLPTMNSQSHSVKMDMFTELVKLKVCLPVILPDNIFNLGVSDQPLSLTVTVLAGAAILNGSIPLPRFTSHSRR